LLLFPTSQSAYSVRAEVRDGLVPLHEEASQDDIRVTVNTLMNRFISKCLKDYHEGAMRSESDCWAQNVFMQKRMSFNCVIFMITLSQRWSFSFLGSCEWFPWNNLSFCPDRA